MALTRILNNQVTDASAGNTYLGINAGTKVQDYSVTAGKLANNLTYASNLTVQGNLDVQGTTTTIDTYNVVIEDPLLLLAKDQTGSPSFDIGFIGERGSSENIAFAWIEANDEFATIFTNTAVSNTTVNVVSYANFHTFDANVAGNLTVGGTTSIGNVTIGNISVTGQINATGNITGGNLNSNAGITGTTLTTTGTATVGNVSTSGTVDATGNISGGNLTSNGSATVTTTATVGNLSTAGTVNATGNITGGNLNSNGTITGTTITTTSTGTFGNVSTAGTVNATGNITGGNLNSNGTITGTTITTTGTATVGNLSTAGTVNATGNISGGNLISNGSATVTTTATVGNLSTAGFVAATGNVSGGNLISNGSATVTTTATVGNLSTAGTVNATGNISGGNLISNNNISGATLNTTGNAVIGGNLIVQGNITYINIDDLRVEDPIIILGTGPNGAPLTTNDGRDRGIYMEYYTTGLGNAFMGFDNSTGNMVIANDVTFSGNDIVAVTAYGTLEAGNIYAQSLVSTGTATVGNLSTTGTINATGNITGGNLNSNGTITGTTLTTTGTATVGNLSTAGTVNATGNVSGGNIVSNAAITGTTLTTTGAISATSGTISTTGNISGGNINATANVVGVGAVFSGNVTAQTFIGNISGNIDAAGANTQVQFNDDDILGASSSFTFDKATNLMTVGNISTGGTINATGNIAGGNLTSNGSATVTTTATVGNLSTAGTVNATGNIAGGNLTSNGALSVTTTGTLGNLEVTGTGNIVGKTIIGNVLLNSANTANAALAVGASTSILIAVGNTSQRPDVGVTGMLRFNTQTDSLEYYDNDSWTSAGTTFTVIVADSFVGNGVANVFTLSQTSTTASTIVSINGIVQIPTTAYSVSGNALTFTEAPAVSDVIDARILTTTTTVTGLSSGSASITGDGSNAFILTGNFLNGNANGSGNIGSATGYFNTIFATATAAQYADLAEMYEADGIIEPGTVVCFGGAKEVTMCTEDACRRVAGVVSTNPSYIMNAGLAGDHVVAVALTGRVPTRVTGTIRKGDMLVAADNGRARAEADPVTGSIIGKALADFDGADGVIEVVVGRL